MSSYLQELEDRFLRYVQINTQSRETSDAVPSTAIQLDLLRQLADELEAIGAVDITLTDYACLMGTIPATSDKENLPPSPSSPTSIPPLPSAAPASNPSSTAATTGRKSSCRTMRRR
jgi:hypothetical protein